ncbi:MAG: SDR family oxidoreductase [Bacteroidia bacterium]
MIALVTGANRGIGLETVKQLTDQGHIVYLGSRNFEKGIKAKAQIDNQENVSVIQLDVTNNKSIESAVAQIIDEQGKLEILVNNAAINYDTYHNAINADLDNVRETFEANILGAWRMIQEVLPQMQTQSFGRIVNVSSGLGSISNMRTGSPGYSISKAALNILTIQFAQLIKSKDILVNSISPGWVRTDMGGYNADRSVEEGADGIVWAAQLPKGGPTGKFFRDKKEIEY